MTLPEEVRAHAAHVAAHARWVRIDLDRAQHVEPGDEPQLDPDRHYLDGPPDAVAAQAILDRHGLTEPFWRLPA